MSLSPSQRRQAAELEGMRKAAERVRLFIRTEDICGETGDGRSWSQHIYADLLELIREHESLALAPERIPHA